MRLRNVRFAVPALAALERPRALSLLPKLVPLEAATFKAAMHRLMLTQPVTGASRIVIRQKETTAEAGAVSVMLYAPVQEQRAQHAHVMPVPSPRLRLPRKIEMIQVRTGPQG